MQIYGAYTHGIDGHLFTVSAAPNTTGRLRITGLPHAAAEHAGNIATTALRRLNPGAVATDLHAEPAGDHAPPLGAARFIRSIEIPLALAALAAHRNVPPHRFEKTVAVGGLDPYRPAREETPCIPARGITAIAETVRRRTLALVVPWENAAAALSECASTTGAHTFEQLLAVAAGESEPPFVPPARTPEREPLRMWGVGEDQLRAVEIACAGCHAISIVGPPSGSLPNYGRLAQALLPDLAGDDARVTTKIHSIAGLRHPMAEHMVEPPLRIPHYTASWSAISGTRGCSGEVSLAHNGVFVVDQPAEYDRRPLAAVARAAVEHETIALHLSPVEHTVRVPADFLLAVTSRPDEVTERRHRSAPVLDLCDIQIEAPIPAGEPVDPHEVVARRARVAAARRMLASGRPRGAPSIGNASVRGRRARALARTIAALACERQVRPEHLEEAHALANPADTAAS